MESEHWGGVSKDQSMLGQTGSTYLLPHEVLVVGARPEVHDLELRGAQVPVRRELDVGLVQVALDGHIAQILEEAKERERKWK